MEPFLLMGVEIDQCGNCGGVWLDNEELARITRGRGRDALQLKVINRTVADMPCPRCGRVLEMGSHSEDLEFLIDVCVECQGCFLNRGEFARLLARKA